ncbi:MAG: hypothetical protein GC159_18365 [Phycisphaera sp.]|nr:hypothetical protein [Phycisphaera sp.]
MVSPDKALGDEMGLPRRWLKRRFDEFEQAPRPLLRDSEDAPRSAAASEKLAADVLLDKSVEQPAKRKPGQRLVRGIRRLLDV